MVSRMGLSNLSCMFKIAASRLKSLLSTLIQLGFFTRCYLDLNGDFPKAESDFTYVNTN